MEYKKINIEGDQFYMIDREIIENQLPSLIIQLPKSGKEKYHIAFYPNTKLKITPWYTGYKKVSSIDLADIVIYRDKNEFYGQFNGDIVYQKKDGTYYYDCNCDDFYDEIDCCLCEDLVDIEKVYSQINKLKSKKIVLLSDLDIKNDLDDECFMKVFDLIMSSDSELHNLAVSILNGINYKNQERLDFLGNLIEKFTEVRFCDFHVNSIDSLYEWFEFVGKSQDPLMEKYLGSVVKGMVEGEENRKLKYDLEISLKRR